METIKTILINTSIIPIGIGLIILLIYIVKRIIPVNIKDYLSKYSGYLFLVFLTIVLLLIISFLYGNFIMRGLGYSYIPIGDMQ